MKISGSDRLRCRRNRFMVPTAIHAEVWRSASLGLSGCLDRPTSAAGSETAHCLGVHPLL